MFPVHHHKPQTATIHRAPVKFLFSFNQQHLQNSFQCLIDSDRLRKVTEPLLSVISSTHSWSTSNLSFHISAPSRQEHIAHIGVTFATYIPAEKMNPQAHTDRYLMRDFITFGAKEQGKKIILIIITIIIENNIT